jgi:hypothetical protein
MAPVFIEVTDEKNGLLIRVNTAHIIMIDSTEMDITGCWVHTTFGKRNFREAAAEVEQLIKKAHAA